MNEERKGGCRCGTVRFRIDGALNWVAYCHCCDCRRSSAAPVSLFVGTNEANYSLTAGAPSRYASAAGVERTFCGQCGTPLTYRSHRFPGELHILAGALDEPERLEPQFHVWTDERLPYFDTIDHLPRIARSGLD